MTEYHAKLRESRYALFAGEHYYPSGGVDDLRGCYATVEEAMLGVRPQDDWAHVVDLETLTKLRLYVANGNEKVDGEWRKAAPKWSDA